MNDEKLFLNVPLNSNDPNPCSPPDPGPNWRGIVIRAPSQVSLKRNSNIGEHEFLGPIPICGYFLLNVPTVRWTKPMRLIAVNKSTGTAYSGDIVELDPSPDVPPPVEEESLSSEELQGLAVGGYFNPNLIDFVRLPYEPAVYDVYVEFRGFLSNVVSIEIVKEKI